MADMAQVQLVKQGRDAVAKWREEHPNEVLDLNASYLSYARLHQVDLRGADIRDSDLMGAILVRANLSGCHLNPCHMYRADLRQADLSRSLMNGANLRGANLREANLSNADMDRAVLSDANLTGADLSNANMSRVNLTGANLTNANLTGAVLHRAQLTHANLSGAILDGADFYEANLNDASLSETKFAGCIVGYTVFQNCDFSVAEGLDDVRHDAPSTIGLDTLYRSGGKINDLFLRSAGALESAVEFQKSLLGTPVPPGDCFISCSSQDAAFAQSLQTGLQAHGIRCWVFSEDTRGNALVERHSTSDQEEVERWIRSYDKLVVVCSEAGLDTEVVRNDIEQAQGFQQDKDQWLLYIVAPDSSLTRGRGRLGRTIASEHVVFDLSGQAGNTDEYGQELTRLAEALKVTQPRVEGIPKYGDSL